MSPAACAERITWRGLACTRLTLPNGDRVVVADLGAQVLSWVASGAERLFLSPQAVLDGSAPIRGGIPVCFPQFNARGPLPKHGLARRATWQCDPAAAVVDPQQVQHSWRWQDDAASRAQWPYAFHAALTVTLRPGALTVQLAAVNTGNEPWPFTAALHTYLHTDDVTQCQLHGLQDLGYWDAAQAFAPAVQQGAVVFGGEVDRVYPAAPQPLHLAGGVPRPLHIHQDAAWAETVVWNPGPSLCAQLADMAPDSWRHMLCVEAAQINQPAALLPGARWQGSQTLTVG